MTQPPPPANAGSLVGTRLGKYDVLALLALGGTGEIYLARIGGEAGFEKYVVVKSLHDHLADDQDFVKMFLDEARLGAQLDHSNIVQTLELGQEGSRYYLVMEYLAGMSLAMVARKTRHRVPDGRIPVPLVLGLAAQACAGLHYAHERTTSSGAPLNIVHRDISPQNLVVSFEGILKIVDFGIAHASVRETHTRSGTIKGKFAYMSPEQCLAKPLDRRSDIFALGTLCHEFLTGRRLFKRESTYDTYQAIIAGKVPSPSEVNHELDPSLDEVIMRALAYRAEDRYATAEQFGEAMLSVLHSRGKSVNASDVARFFEQHFNQEIEEHHQRMRELIAGRKQTMDDLAWDVADIESYGAAAMPDDHPETIDHAVPTLDEADLVEEVEPGGGDEIEGEATRIELNPLERMAALHAEQEATKSPGKPPKSRFPSNVPTEIAKPETPKVELATVPSVSGPAGKAEQRRTLQGRKSPAEVVEAAARARNQQDNPEPPTPTPAAAGGKGPTAAPDARTLFGGAAPTPEQIKAAAESARKAIGSAATGAAAPSAAAGPGAPPNRPASPPAAANQPNPSPWSPSPGATPSGGPGWAAPGSPSGPAPGAPSGPAPGAPSGPAPGAPWPGNPPPSDQVAPSPHARAAEAVLQQREAFPPISTPTAFRARADLIPDGPALDSGTGDLSLLANERHQEGRIGRPATFLLILAFVVSAGIGLGITLLIGQLT